MTVVDGFSAGFEKFRGLSLELPFELTLRTVSLLSFGFPIGLNGGTIYVLSGELCRGLRLCDGGYLCLEDPGWLSISSLILRPVAKLKLEGTLEIGSSGSMLIDFLVPPFLRTGV